MDPRDAALTVALDRFLDGTAQVLGDRTGVRSQSDVVTLALAHRVLQIANAVTVLCAEGHAGEAGPLARAALSGAATFSALLVPDREGLVRSFIEAIEMDEVQFARTAEALELTDERAVALRDELRAGAEMNSAAFDAAPARRVGPGQRYWHGLKSERALFEHVGMLQWYDLFYTVFSSESHVDGRAISREVHEVQRGHVDLGRKFEPVWEPIIATGNAVEVVLRGLARDYAFAEAEIEKIDALAQTFGSALASYQTPPSHGKRT